MKDDQNKYMMLASACPTINKMAYCPSVVRSECGNVYVVGTTVGQSSLSMPDMVKSKIGPGESAVMIPETVLIEAAKKILD